MPNLVTFHLLSYHPSRLELLQGINMQDITKLKAAGVCTILGVAQTTRKNLLKIKVSGKCSR